MCDENKTKKESLVRVFVNLRAVLRVNNLLSGCVAALLLGLATHYRESSDYVIFNMTQVI